jgi:chromosomal replication initiation ATPase DnaA
MTKELNQLKIQLEYVLAQKPTNQELREFLYDHLKKIQELIEIDCSISDCIVKFDTSKITGEYLQQDEVKKIAANILKIKKSEISSGSRIKEVVCARWLVIYYFDKFADYTREQQGAIVGKDHCTAFNAVENIKYFTGWRKQAKTIFEHTINECHKAVGIKKTFNN